MRAKLFLSLLFLPAICWGNISMSAPPTRSLSWSSITGVPAEINSGTAQALGKFRAAMAKSRTGTVSVVKILCVGDSNTAGYGDVGATWVGALAKSYPVALVSALTSLGVPSQNSSFISQSVDRSDSTPASDYDPRISIGVGWGKDPIFKCLGGNWFVNTSGAGTMSFTPVQQFDTAEVYYLKNTTLGVMGVNVDGGASFLTLSESGTPGVYAASGGVALGTHTLNFVTNSGTTYLLGALTYNSTASKVCVIQAGVGGEVFFFWNTSTWDAQKAIAPIAPDLTIINMGINDINASYSAANFQTKLDGAVVAAQASGSVIIASYVPFSSANYAVYNPQYLAAMQTVATNRGCVFLNFSSRIPDYATRVSLGLSFDTLHPNASGYSDYAYWLAAFLQQHL